MSKIEDLVFWPHRIWARAERTYRGKGGKTVKLTWASVVHASGMQALMDGFQALSDQITMER